ncbi:MAG: class I SAM-dependent RNA methyltransferase [Granulosicoccus sp.]
MKDKSGWNKYRRKKKPIALPETELVVESLTNSGDGLGRIDERVVFVPFTAPGDKVRIKIRQRKKTYALAEVVEILSPSASRVTPQCAYFQKCGGCQWQHIPYSEQLDAKTAQLHDTLTRIGGLPKDLQIEPIIASDNPYAYRNRIQGELSAGQFHYKWRKSDQRLAVKRCDIADERINDFLQEDLSGFDAGKVELALVEDEVVLLPVNEHSSTELGFRQINTQVSQILTELILEAVNNSSATTITDLYCGRGTWSLSIAAAHSDKEVTGIDSSSANIQLAKESAQNKQLNNVFFQQTKVEKALGKLNLENSLCIVDPPRAGLDATVVDSLTTQKPAEIIYVSCHPATLSRDLQKLTQSSYRIKTVQPLDMFPQTAHLECFVHLIRLND